MAKKIVARFIIQIGGKPMENVQKALEHILDKLKSESDKFKIIDAELEKPELNEDSSLYVGFIEVSAEFKDSQSIMNFILDYTPVSIEVESPELIELENSDFSSVLNDMTNFILAYQNEIRKLRAQVHILNKKLENNK